MNNLDKLSHDMCSLEDKRDSTYLTEDEANHLNCLYVETEKEHVKLCENQ